MPKFDELMSQANQLGIPTNSGVYKPKSQAWDELKISEWELLRRIKDERRHRRRTQTLACRSGFIGRIHAFHGGGMERDLSAFVPLKL
jgi:hypothetical protein